MFSSAAFDRCVITQRDESLLPALVRICGREDRSSCVFDQLLSRHHCVVE